MVRVIINADDFGKSLERNRAIDDAFKQGLISSANMIVTGQYLQDAVNKAVEGGYLNKLHIHFNLATNLLHENSNDIPLTEGIKKDSYFCKDGKFIKYHGLPKSFLSIRKWKVVYNELEGQYKKFIEITQGQANYNHIDFHLWYNLTWPGAIALRRFTKKHKILSVRYLTILQQKNWKNKFFCLLSSRQGVMSVSSCSIFYFVNNWRSLLGNVVIELFCHPNYKDGVFLDDTPSYLNYEERRPMQQIIDELRKLEKIEYISWEDYV